MTSPSILLAAPHVHPSPPVQQQLELLQRTVDEYARAVAETTGASSHELAPEAAVVAQLRRARLEIRAQTGLVRSLPYLRDDRAS